MADVKWIKITTDIFDDEKILLIESLPDAYAIITVWFKLLCLAGKQNNSGVFMMGQMPYTDSMLATIFRMKEATVTMALKTFEQFGMVEIIDGVITIPNWGKHQNLDQLESKKAYMRNYMQEYREKQKALTSGENSCKSNSKTNSKANVSSADKEKDIEKDKDRDKRKKSKKEDSLTLFDKLSLDYDFSGSLIRKIRDWLTYKTERKEDYTEQGLKALLSRIASKSQEYGDTALIELIDESMSNNWKGIIFDRLKEKPKQGSFDTESFFNAAVSKSLGPRAVLEREASERMENKHVETAETNEYLRKKAEELKNKGIGVAQ